MTTTTPSGYYDRTFVGTPTDLATILRAANSTGRLVGMTTPRPYAADPTRQTIRIRMRSADLVPHTSRPHPATRTTTRTARAPRRKSREETMLWLIPTLLILGLVAAVVALAAIVITWVFTHLLLIAGALAALILICLALGVTSGACPGIHCPGCRHH